MRPSSTEIHTYLNQHPWFKQDEQFRDIATSLITRHANPSSLPNPVITSENIEDLAAVKYPQDLPSRIHTLFTLTH